jgi:hypothetical protein
MGLDDYRNLPPKSDWLEELENQAENRELAVCYSYLAANSYYFKIEGTETCAVGKTHHTRASDRTESKINLNTVEEATWRENLEEIPVTIEDDSELVDIFGIVIDHRGPGRYQADRDNFLVLTEDILGEIPESGNKEFRITSTGYRHPFDKHVNSWERIFANL